MNTLSKQWNYFEPFVINCGTYLLVSRPFRQKHMSIQSQECKRKQSKIIQVLNIQLG